MRQPPLLPRPPTLHHGGHQEGPARAWIPPCPSSRTLLEELSPLFSLLCPSLCLPQVPDHTPPWAGGGLTAAWLLLTAPHCSSLLPKAFGRGRRKPKASPAGLGASRRNEKLNPKATSRDGDRKEVSSSGESPPVTHPRGVSPPKPAPEPLPRADSWTDLLLVE